MGEAPSVPELRARVEALGGELQVDPKQGFLVTIPLPSGGVEVFGAHFRWDLHRELVKQENRRG